MRAIFPPTCRPAKYHKVHYAYIVESAGAPGRTDELVPKNWARV
jgi:hypothetical protein